MDPPMASLCTATNLKLVNFLFWTPTNANCVQKWWDIQEKLIKTINTIAFYSKFKEEHENDMAWHDFLVIFYSSRQLSQIGPTAENDSAASPPPIFFRDHIYLVVHTIFAKDFRGTYRYLESL